MNPVQLFVNQHQHAVITCVSSSVSMTTNITDSLERIPRPGLRSADATAPPRSLSQGATSSRLPAAAAAVHEPQLPTSSATAATHIGSPLRPVRARASPRTPAVTPVTSNAGRGIEDALLQRTRLENSDLRMQLALAQQLADSDRRLAESDRRLADSERRLQEQQFASDLQIRELTIRAELLVASALVPQPQNLNVVAVGAKYTFQLAMTTLTNFVQNPTLAVPISLDAVVDVNQIAVVVATLFKLLGSVDGAAQYKQFLQHALQLPDPGGDTPASGYSDSAECARLDSVFGVEERPSSPEGSSASAVTSVSSHHRHTESTADRVAAILYGETALADQLLSRFRTVDEVLLSYLRHLIAARPGTAVHDCTLYTTFIRCLAGLLRCAGHGADKDEKRWMAAAYGPCDRYAAQGGVEALTIAQLSDAAIRDWTKRRHNLGRLNLDGIAAVLTVAGMPTATGGLKLEAGNELKKVLIKLAGSGNMDVATLTAAMDDAVDEFRQLPPTGAFSAPDPVALHRALGMIPIPPAPISLAAVVDQQTEPKRATRKQQSVPSAADDDTTTPPAGKIMCPHGSKCANIVLAWDAAQPNRTTIVRPCRDWHGKREFQVVLAAARDRLVAASAPTTTATEASMAPPVTPVVMPIPPAVVGSPRTALLD